MDWQGLIVNPDKANMARFVELCRDSELFAQIDLASDFRDAKDKLKTSTDIVYIALDFDELDIRTFISESKGRLRKKISFIALKNDPDQIFLETEKQILGDFQAKFDPNIDAQQFKILTSEALDQRAKFEKDEIELKARSIILDILSEININAYLKKNGLETNYDRVVKLKEDLSDTVGDDIEYYRSILLRLMTAVTKSPDFDLNVVSSKIKARLEAQIIKDIIRL